GSVVSLSIWSIEGDVYARPELIRAKLFELLGESRIKGQHHILTAEQQGMDVVSLWYRFVENRPVFDRIPLKYGHALEIVGKHGGRHHACQTATDDDCVFA